MKISLNSKYYFFSIILGLLFWYLFSVLEIEFVNIIFFIMAYVWHFTLLAPNMKNYALKGKNKFSLITLVFKSYYYLQVLINAQFKYKSHLIRAFFPFLFSIFLLLVGGASNILFTLLGSLIFEIYYEFVLKKIIDYSDALETPPASSNEENSHE